MTSRELLSLVVRRWYLMLLGAIISVVALHLITHRPGVYWTQFNVVVLAPVHKFYPNNLEDPPDALAPMAGLLVADWNGAKRQPLMATGDTTLFGQGLRQGIEVRVPNEGSQWQPLFFAPSIDVQVVSTNPERVEQDARRVSTELNGLLQKRQDAMGIRPSQRMTTMTSPTDPTILHVSGSRMRAAAATGLAGAAVTTVAVYWTERWLISNRSRRARLAESTTGQQ
jgi:hypothetical protein